MQRKSPQDKDGNFSFTIVDNKSFDFDESITVENARDIPSPTTSESSDRLDNYSHKNTARRELTTDSEEDDDDHLLTNSSPQRFLSNLSESPVKGMTDEVTMMMSHQSNMKLPSAGPSNRQLGVMIDSPLSREREIPASSDSDSDDSDASLSKRNRLVIPGEYDALQFINLDVTEEIKDLFQYITKYIPQQLNLDFKFKPFIPDFIPAVGDIDAFLKVISPPVSISGEKFDSSKNQLGLAVLDEPATNQSDSALLHLQLRASTFNVSHANESMVVKTVDNVEKNSKTIDKWVKDVTDLHKSKTAPVVKYTNPMPDLDELMQEWPEDVENMLKIQGFPHYSFPGTLSQYAAFVCSLFDIPVYKNKIQSLHMLFCLYAAIKSSQLYRSQMANKDFAEGEMNSKSGGTDQLVLE